MLRLSNILIIIIIIIKSGDDWVLACRNVEVVKEKCRGKVRKTWSECVNDDMKLLGLQPEWAFLRDVDSIRFWAKVSP